MDILNECIEEIHVLVLCTYVHTYICRRQQKVWVKTKIQTKSQDFSLMHKSV